MAIYIRSQDKMSLVNMDSYLAISIEKYYDGYALISNDDEAISIYSSKERALEVLDKIQEHIESIKSGEYLIQKILDNMPEIYNEKEYIEKLKKLSCVYEMPQN